MTEEKATVKKSVAKKKAAKKASAKAASSTAKASDISPVLDELRKDRESRDKQMQDLIQELRKGLAQVAVQGQADDANRKKEFDQLIRGLNAAFDRADKVSSDSESRSENKISRLTDTLIMEHQQFQSDLKEQERLQERKLKYINKQQEAQTSRLKRLAIPGMVIAVLAVIYMFYLVSVMEGSMKSMSEDMRAMRGTMSEITTEINTMGQDTRTMSNNMAIMSQEMTHMSRTVAPAMTGIRRAMPWSP